MIQRLTLIAALSLDFYGRVRFLRTVFIPGARDGIEASFLSQKEAYWRCDRRW